MVRVRSSTVVENVEYSDDDLISSLPYPQPHTPQLPPSNIKNSRYNPSRALSRNSLLDSKLLKSPLSALNSPNLLDLLPNNYSDIRLSIASNSVERPLSSLTNQFDDMLTSRPISSMLIEHPDSPDVTGMRGRYKLQKEMVPSSVDSYNMRNGRWCDTERKYLAAYEYLCHVVEAKQWIELCIGRELPPIEQLEESLRDGIALAELARLICPSLNVRIYKGPSRRSSRRNSRRQRANKLNFKHTDNINYFLKAIDYIGLPRQFWFELTDVYDGKNIPKLIYCIHATSHFLESQGITVGIQDLVGHLEFSEHQLEQTQLKLDNLGNSNLDQFTDLNRRVSDEHRRLSNSIPSINKSNSSNSTLSTKSILNTSIFKIPPPEDEIIGSSSSIARDFSSGKFVDFCKVNPEFLLLLQYMIRRFLAIKIDTAEHIQYYNQIIQATKFIQKMARGVSARKFAAQLSIAKRTPVKPYGSLDLVGPRRRSSLVSNSLRDSEIRDQIDLERLAAEFRIQSDLINSQKIAEMDRLESIRLAEEAEIIRLQAQLAEKKKIELAQQKMLEFEELKKAELEKELAEKKRIEALERIEAQKLEMQKDELLERIIMIQAYCRSELTRRLVKKMKSWSDNIKAVQSKCRGYLIRMEYKDKLNSWHIVHERIRQVQAICRGNLVRRLFKSRDEHYKRNIRVVINCQNLLRAKLANIAYRSLTIQDAVPTPKTISTCAPLLEDTDQDLQEELEIENLRHVVINKIRNNQNTEHNLKELDIKIALLVRNKISLEEIIKQHKSFFQLFKDFRSPSYISNSSFRDSMTNFNLSGSAPPGSLYSLRNLNRESQRRLDSYQHLIYLLQTQPIYLSRLLCCQNSYSDTPSDNGSSRPDIPRNVSQNFGFNADVSNSSTKKEILSDSTLFSIFGYAQNSREDYLLLNLMRSVLSIEIEKADRLDFFNSGFSKFSKLFKVYCNLDKEVKYVSTIFYPIIKNFLTKPVNSFELDPLVIYKSSIQEFETKTGKKSPKPLDVTRDQALADPETRPIYIENLVFLRELTNEFSDSILSSLNSMPYGIRYLANELKTCLSEKFPHKSESEVLSKVCSLVFQSYFNPYISSPVESNLVNPQSISDSHKKCLRLSSEILQYVASGRQFSTSHVFLQPLNNFVKFSSARFLEYMYSLTMVSSIEAQYQIDEFSDFVNVNNLVLHLTVEDLLNIHYSIYSNLEQIAPKLSHDVKEIAEGHEALRRWLRRSARRSSLRKYNSTYFNESAAALTLSSIASIPNSSDNNVLDNIIDILPPGTVLVERVDEFNPSNKYLVLDDPLLVISRELGPPPRLRKDPYSSSELTLILSDRFAYDSMSFMTSTSSQASVSTIDIKSSPRLVNSALAIADNKTRGLFNLETEKSSAMHSLFLKTKRMWIAILRVQSGNSLLEILKLPVSIDDDLRWKFVVRDELFKLEQRRKHLQASWDSQQKAQELLNSAKISQTMNGDSESSKIIESATKIPDLPIKMPPIPGELVIREFQNMSFTELKLSVMNYMQTLEVSRWVEKPRRSAIGGSKSKREPSLPNSFSFKIRAADNYQGMLNAIARDLKTKSSRRDERRAELRKIRQTLISLEKKTGYLESQRLVFEQYLNSCVEKLTMNSSKPGGFSRFGTKLSNTGKFIKNKIFSSSKSNLSDINTSSANNFSNWKNDVPKFGIYKYNAEKLYLKGVLISVEGFGPRQLDKLSITISCNEPGVFDLSLYLLGSPMQGGKAELLLDELYEKEYNNIAVIRLFDDKVKLNVNLLSFLINKKFFR
ncbi:Ras GTPase-activating-like protein IQGAP1 [Smittium mucronatum]|uniref:Ras GTPase-activating-like protein IQGAP1 n=1 Tax=Smittium mucronatum TaxID=133383 RepID=A0A1R0GLF4_9FUNG|nr:Ras GTPase-activating-like protein IQGAP1 [Smittium mucronatum]